MTAHNVVRFRVKPGREQEFLDAHRHLQRDFPKLRGGGLKGLGNGSAAARATDRRASRGMVAAREPQGTDSRHPRGL